MFYCLGFLVQESKEILFRALESERKMCYSGDMFDSWIYFSPIEMKRKECYIKVSVFVYFQIIRATLSGHPKMISLSALSYVCPSVCPSVCPFKISCPDHIFSTLGPIWLILRPQSAFGQKVCVDLEPIFKVTFEDHSRII